MTVQPSFIHLRVHTEYSLVDGLVRVKSLMSALAEDGMPLGFHHTKTFLRIQPLPVIAMAKREGIMQRDFGAAILALQNLLVTTRIEDITDKASYRLGWIYIEMAEWDRARKQFSRISESNQMKYNMQQLLHELEQEKEVKRKSPRLAGFLSIVPGGWFAYRGRYQDAFMALLVNGGLIWAAYEAFDNDLPALGACITVVGFGFYAGNIYGGVSSAHKYNNNQTQNFIEQLKQNTKISLGIDPKGGVALAINYRF